MLKKILKSIHNFFLIFGINISFVKKEKNISTIFHNSEQGMDEFWKNSKKTKFWEIPELAKFYGLIYDLLIKKNIDLNTKLFADMGCGTGSLIYYLNQFYKPAKNYGFEFSKAALEIAKTNFPDAEYQYFDLLHSKTDLKFDFQICTEVLEHVSDPYKALENLISMMSDKGIVLITVPDGRKDTFEGHLNFWSPESWNMFISKFAPEKIIETGRIEGFSLYALIKNKP